MQNRPQPKHSSGYKQPTGDSPPAASAASSALTIAVAATMLGGIWWWMAGESPRQVDEAKRPAGVRDTSTPVPQDAASVAATGRISPPVSTAGNGHEPGEAEPPFDAARTSWQNPFEPAYWISEGWAIHPQAMESGGPEAATATFRREYQKVTLECRVAPVGKPGAFLVRLYAPETNALLETRFSADEVAVSSEIKGRRSRLLRRRFRVPFVAGHPTTLRLTATGNRVLVRSGRRLLINCTQPGELSGKALRVSVGSDGGAFRVTELRLEGE